MTDFSDSDADFMWQAIELARARMGTTWPNPTVGCVVVRDGQVLAEGVTGPGGHGHAEELALSRSIVGFNGATAYLTLEPCGRRSRGTRSCSLLFATAGLRRVVVACTDPSPYASGLGIRHLRCDGVIVETGLLSDFAASLSEGFVHRLKTGRPVVRISATGEGFDERFRAAPNDDLMTKLRQLGAEGYGRVWVRPGALADALDAGGLLTP